MKIDKQIVLDLPSGPGNPRNSEGAFLATPDGGLMYLFSRYEGASWHDSASAQLAARYSGDGGTHWSTEDRIVIRRGDAANLMSCSLLPLPSGRIILVYMRKDRIAGCDTDTPDDGMFTCIPWRCFSDDGGVSWRAAEPVIRFPGYYVVNNDRLVRLSGGRLLLPVAHHRYAQSDGKLEFGPTGLVDMYYSDDDGERWSRAPESIYPPAGNRDGLQEPGVVELNDGRVMVYCRTSSGFHYKAFSSDRGDSWSAAEPAREFPAPMSPMLIKRNPWTGRLWAVWNDSDPRWDFHPADPDHTWWRTPLALAQSDDDGAGWHSHVLLENDPGRGYCYPSLHFLSCDTFLLGTCCGGYGHVCLQDSHVLRIQLRQQ